MSGIALGAGVIVGAGLGWWGALAVAMVAFIAALLDPRRHSWAVAGVVVLAAGVGAWRAASVDAQPRTGGAFSALQAAVVVSDPKRDGRYQQFVVEGAFSGPGGQSRGARTCVIGDAAPIVRQGDWLTLKGAGRAASDSTQGQRAFLAMHDCQRSLFATSIAITGMTDSPQRALADVRARIEAILRRSAPGDAGVLLSGLVTGDDAGFSNARENAFANSATTHLTAVSGSNLALVAGICAAVGSATVGRHRMAWQAASIAAIWSYALISGLQAPAIRAAIVTTGAILAFRCGRRPDFVTLIVLAAGTMVLLDPRQIEGLGFRLSVAASLALAVVLPATIERGRSAAVAGIVLATAAAQLATLPFLLPIFGTISLLGLPANVIVAPFVALAMPIAFCAAIIGLGSPAVAEVVAAPAALAAKATLGIVDLFGAPSASIRFGTPPIEVAWVMGATAAVLLLALGGQSAGLSAGSRFVGRTRRALLRGAGKRTARGVSHPAPPVLTTAPPIGDGD